jgi:hypothetical protein
MSDQATIIAIADALRDLLNGVSFSQQFTATREYAPEYKLEDLATLRVAVVPKAIESNLEARDRARGPWQFDVAFHKRVAPGETQLLELDALMLLVEEVSDWIWTHPLDAVPGTAWLKNANDPMYDPEKLQTDSVFLSVLTVTYAVTRKIAR